MAGLNIKNEVLYRVYLILLLVVLFAAAIAFQTFKVAILEGPKWRAQKQELYIRRDKVQAPRGNIYSDNGSLLATSLPFFEIRMDLVTIPDELFENEVDSLALCLATYVDDSYTPGGYRDYLVAQRDSGQRYLLIKKNVNYIEKEFIGSFPILREGQFRGGFIAKPTHDRMYPFRQLARRTIGYAKEGYNPVGLEGYFNERLEGASGSRLVFRAGRAWIPLNDYTEIEPKRGDDIYTTIDVNIQDVVHRAVYQAVNYHQAENGVAIVMEVETGAIKAITNLSRVEDRGWYETYNHAVGSAWEPGSTFKLASVMAMLEDGVLTLSDSIPLFQGYAQFYEEEMMDAVAHGLDSTTLQRAFELSSNVGIAMQVQQHYGFDERAYQFIERLQSFYLHLPTGIEIEGEAAPYIKEPFSQEDQWSGTTLPWMSTGYEVTVTPLQLLTFYNAVANDGKMMKPHLVREIWDEGVLKKRYRTTVVKKDIASEATIRKAQELLRGVVENGTASDLNTEAYAFAGKTGTAQINYRLSKSGRERLKYRASFVGYFPAEKPRYSCIVVISDPKQHGRYGGEVAGPVFRQIADELYASRVAVEKPFNLGPKPPMTHKKLPEWRAGWKEDFGYLLEYFDLPYEMQSREEWTVVLAPEGRDTLEVQTRDVKVDEEVPNVVGMGLRDAIYLLENRGLKVQVNGYGRVVQQSIIPGTPSRGQTVRIFLN